MRAKLWDLAEELGEEHEETKRAEVVEQVAETEVSAAEAWLRAGSVLVEEAAAVAEETAADDDVVDVPHLHRWRRRQETYCGNIICLFCKEVVTLTVIAYVYLRAYPVMWLYVAVLLNRFLQICIWLSLCIEWMLFFWYVVALI